MLFSANQILLLELHCKRHVHHNIPVNFHVFETRSEATLGPLSAEHVLGRERSALRFSILRVRESSQIFG